MTTRMGLEGIMLSEITQTGGDKYHMISHICGIYKIKPMNTQTNKHETDVNTKNQLAVAREAVRGGRVQQVKGIERCKLSVTE